MAHTEIARYKADPEQVLPEDEKIKGLGFRVLDE